MAIPLEEILNEMPLERRKRIKAQADKYRKEYQTLQELKKKLNLTQTNIAQNM